MLVLMKLFPPPRPLGRWLVRGAMRVGTAMPRLLAATGGLRLMRYKGCSEAEAALFASEFASEASER